MSLALLQLMQLADSALPIGSTAHSFGLETLTHSGLLMPHTVEGLLVDHLAEAGRVEALCCRLAYRLAAQPIDEANLTQWRNLNLQLSARKPARESREASATLGRRFLQLAAMVEPHRWLVETAARSRQGASLVQHSPAFGLVGGVLALGEEATVAAFLQQMTSGLLSACQRLLPLGQNQAMQIAWRLKAQMAMVMQSTQVTEATTGVALLAELTSVQPMLEIASMRHPTLTTRLFIS